MGYTHYWDSLKVTEDLAEVTKEMIRISDVLIRGSAGKGEPEIKSNRLCFNGDEQKNEDCDTFCLDNTTEGFDFCKTNGKPYDDVVVGVLVAAIDLENPGYESIRTDGTINDWEDGIKLYCNAYENLHGHSLDWKFAKKCVAEQLRKNRILREAVGEL